MPQYDKLVRDRIHEIIKEQGRQLTISILNDEEYLAKLNEKLREELAEYLETKDDSDRIEELADMLEVIYAIAGAKGITVEELEAIRREKAKKRGVFKARILLRWVED